LLLEKFSPVLNNVSRKEGWEEAMQRIYIQYRIHDNAFLGQLRAIEVSVPEFVPDVFGKLWARWVVMDRLVSTTGCHISAIQIVNVLEIPGDISAKASSWDVLLTHA
jgi:hypothetical protein